MAFYLFVCPTFVLYQIRFCLNHVIIVLMQIVEIILILASSRVGGAGRGKPGGRVGLSKKTSSEENNEK